MRRGAARAHRAKPTCRSSVPGERSETRDPGATVVLLLGPGSRSRAAARPTQTARRSLGRDTPRCVSLSVDRQTERHSARELALRPLLQGMKARALHVAEQPFEAEPAEIAGAAHGIERQIDGPDRVAAD